jgi:hypothetical protein
MEIEMQLKRGGDLTLKNSRTSDGEKIIAKNAFSYLMY